MRELVFIHGAGGAVDDPEYGSAQLVGFLRNGLADDCRLRAPLMPMPDPEATRASAWIEALDQELGDFPEDGVLIGHSTGGAMILKFIAEKRPALSAAGLVMIASPFWGEPDWQVEQYYLPVGFADRVSGLKRILLFIAATTPSYRSSTWRSTTSIFHDRFLMQLMGWVILLDKGTGAS